MELDQALPEVIKCYEVKESQDLDRKNSILEIPEHRRDQPVDH